MKTTARVRLTIEIDLSQPWPNDCRLSDVWGTAAKEARNEVFKANHHFRVIGEPEVTAVMVDEGKDVK